MDRGCLPDPLSGVLSRVESLRNGIAASLGLPSEDALVEAVLVLDDALERSRTAFFDAIGHRDGMSASDVCMLLSAERCWLEVLRDMLVVGDDLPPARLRRVLSALPG